MATELVGMHNTIHTTLEYLSIQLWNLQTQYRNDLEPGTGACVNQRRRLPGPDPEPLWPEAMWVAAWLATSSDATIDAVKSAERCRFAEAGRRDLGRGRGGWLTEAQMGFKSFTGWIEAALVL